MERDLNEQHVHGVWHKSKINWVTSIAQCLWSCVSWYHHTTKLPAWTSGRQILFVWCNTADFTQMLIYSFHRGSSRTAWNCSFSDYLCCSSAVTPHFLLFLVLCRPGEVMLTGACRGMQVAGPLSSRGRRHDRRSAPTIQWWTAGLTDRNRYSGDVWKFDSFLHSCLRCPRLST